MQTPEQEKRAQEYFNKEPLQLMDTQASPEHRIANALAYIAYQLWAVNLHLGRLEDKIAK